MYNLLKKILYTFTLASLYAFSSTTLANTYSVQDFKFSMMDPAFGDIGGPTGANIVGSAPWGTIVDGVYQGTNSTNDIVNFTFFGATVSVYTAATNQGSVNTAGGTITGGPAPTFDLVNMTADMSSWFAHWSGTEFLQGNTASDQWDACAANPNVDQLNEIARITDNLDNTYTVDWNSCITTAPFVSQIGFWQLTLECTVGCIPVIAGDADTLSATVAAATTRTVVIGETVDIASSFDGLANYEFVWETDELTGSATAGTYSFTAGTEGLYVFTSTYTDKSTGVDGPWVKGSGSIVIRVVASATVDILDDDNNGIINEYDDSGLAATQLQAELSNAATYVLVSDKGELKLGSAAFCAGTAARLSQADMANYAGINCTAVTNAEDDDSFISVGTGGYHDFEVHGLVMGETASIVIPLNAGIPAHAVYRKYNGNSGIWGTFIQGDGDALASASATSEGICPVPGDAAYTSGLTAGNNCLQLSITDGGLNDADGAANGQIIDPGTLAEINSGTEAQLAGGCSISGNPQNLNEHAEWLLLAAFIAWFGILSYRRKQAE